MTFTSIKPAPTAPPKEPDALAFRIVILLWVLYLFTPHKLLQYYIPAASPVTWLLEILLFVEVGIYFSTNRERRGYPAFTILMGLTVLGVLMAAIFGNWGRAISIVRTFYQPYLLALLTFAFCTTLQRAAVIYKIYFLHLLYFGLWGLASLYYSPLGATDPGLRNIIPWHVNYDNRDAFGPLMVIGFVFSAYYFYAVSPRPKLAILSMMLSLLGIITSFGRGVFLSLLVACGLMWLRAKNKAQISAIVLGLAVLGAAAAPNLAERYLSSMGTIFSEGTHKGTGADRKILWTWASRVFLLNPIAGVGPGNFGIAVFQVVPLREAAQYEYTQGSLWGRALHSTPMTVLSEYGTLGIMAIIFLIYDYFRTNAAVRRQNRAAEARGVPLVAGFSVGYIDNVALALHMAFLTMCINSIFYEIFYIAMLGHLLALNRLLYFATNTHLSGNVGIINPFKNAAFHKLVASRAPRIASASTAVIAVNSAPDKMVIASAQARPAMRGLYK